MSKHYVGIDNGVTGLISVFDPTGHCIHYSRTPTRRCLDYHRGKARFINRIDTEKLRDILRLVPDPAFALVVMEQPAVSPEAYTSSFSAARAFEATLITVEGLGFPYVVIPSSDWQKVLLPKGTKGRENLKAAASGVASKLLPYVDHHNDADGLLIGYYGWKVGL